MSEPWQTDNPKAAMSCHGYQAHTTPALHVSFLLRLLLLLMNFHVFKTPYVSRCLCYQRPWNAKSKERPRDKFSPSFPQTKWYCKKCQLCEHGLTPILPEVSIPVVRQAHLLAQLVGSNCTGSCHGHRAGCLPAKTASNAPAHCTQSKRQIAPHRQKQHAGGKICKKIQ